MNSEGVLINLKWLDIANSVLLKHKNSVPFRELKTLMETDTLFIEQITYLLRLYLYRTATYLLLHFIE